MCLYLLLKNSLALGLDAPLLLQLKMTEITKRPNALHRQARLAECEEMIFFI